MKGFWDGSFHGANVRRTGPTAFFAMPLPLPAAPVRG